jgi:hypothetical protein
MPSVSSDALQTLQIAAITLACLTGMFGEAHRSAITSRLSQRTLVEQEYILSSLPLRSGQRTGWAQCHRRG